MYNNIEIFETDFKDKYLIINEEKSIYGGFLIREIVEQLKQNKNHNEITLYLSKKYKNNFDEENISTIITNQINPILKKDNYKGFKKLFKIIDPSKIPLPLLVQKIFKSSLFYFVLFLTFSFNLIYIIGYNTVKTSSTNEKIIICFSLFIILIVHELGHSFSAKNFKINVREIGLAIYYIFPVLYVNLNESWKLNKFKRTIINLSGIYFQLIIGSLLIVVSILSNQRFITIENLISVNFIILLFNLNPFIKFDGYWVLADLLNENNLSKKSNEILKSFIKFKKNNHPFFLNLYSIMKFFFFCWIIYRMITFFYNRIVNYNISKNLELIDFFSLAIFLFILYNTFYNKFKPKKK